MSLKKHILKKTISLVLVSSGGLGVFSALNIYNENEQFYKNVVMPVVHKFNPETSHKLAVLAAKYGFIPKSKYKDPPTLGTEIWGIQFTNPVGMAAGFDKHGEAVHGLSKMGFGFVEVGSVTPKPQPGNPTPRVFRLTEDEAIINRYGFNSEGHEIVHDRLLNVRSTSGNNLHLSPVIVGVNLGKNKESSDSTFDYVTGIKKFSDVADYLVINVSSPNTPGLRNLQGHKQLEELLSHVVEARNSLPSDLRRPLLLKLAPDLSSQERKEIASVISTDKCKVDGLIISNTTVSRPGLISKDQNEIGGLSGKPVSSLSTHLIAEMYTLTNGKIPIIGVGGIFNGKDAYEKIRAGANLIQLYTSFTFMGPPLVSRIKKELEELLRADGFKSVSEAVGKDASKILSLEWKN